MSNSDKPQLYETGMAVLVSRNHGHFGAAGIYARLTLGHDLLTLVTQGFKLDLKPGMPFYEAIGGAPWAFSAPAGEEDSVVLDFGAKHDLFANSPHREAIIQMAPGIVFRSIKASFGKPHRELGFSRKTAVSSGPLFVPTLEPRSGSAIVQL